MNATDRLRAEERSRLRRLISAQVEEPERPHWSETAKPDGYNVLREVWIAGNPSLSDLGRIEGPSEKDALEMTARYYCVPIESLVAKPYFRGYDKAADEDSRRAEDNYPQESRETSMHDRRIG